MTQNTPSPPTSTNNGAKPAGGGAAGQSAQPLDSLHYAELNPGISTKFKSLTFDPESTNNAMSTIVHGAMKAYEKDNLRGTGPYKAIVLRQEPPWTAEGVDVTSWY